MDNRRKKLKYWSLVSANLLLALADGGLTYYPNYYIVLGKKAKAALRKYDVQKRCAWL